MMQPKRTIFVFLLLLTVLLVLAGAEAESSVILGDEQFEAYLPLLEGKRVALFTNQTGIVGDQSSGIGELRDGADASLLPFGQDAAGNPLTYGEHILDALIRQGVHVTAVFSPEHGFRGTEDAGASVSDSIDEKTGVPILSLYADDETHAPSAESMAKFDILVIDMQDVGLRYYTYYLSMYYLMDACAANGKAVLILDRPNPNGFYVDGPILQEEYRSNVGQLPIPIVYGMTWGELAQMINGEGWLRAGKDACDLTVIPCLNYTHQTKTSIIRNPSPNIKDMRAVYLYASTCFFENTLVSVGRGTQFPFEVYGSPHLIDAEGYSFTFTPESLPGTTEPQFLGEVCYGSDLREVPLEEIWKNQINLEYLVSAFRAVKENAPDVSFWGTPDDQGRYWIDKLTGSASVREQIEEGKTAQEIKDGWQDEINAFLEQRRPYLLYEEYAEDINQVLISYLGPAGTYTEEATQFWFQQGDQLNPKTTVQEAISDLVNGVAEFSVIPQENTVGSAVTNYVDALIAAEDVYVVGEVVLPISQTLMGVPGASLDDITLVCSHAQGLTQSAAWRAEHLPDAQTQKLSSTAAAGHVAEQQNKSITAVAEPAAAEHYGLEVLATNVQITNANKTRFYVLSRKALRENGFPRAVLVSTCEVNQIDDIIASIHDARLELVSLHDRLEGSALGSYHYVVEVENTSGITEEQFSIVQALTSVRFLGCFNDVEK